MRLVDRMEWWIQLECGIGEKKKDETFEMLKVVSMEGKMDKELMRGRETEEESQK